LIAFIIFPDISPLIMADCTPDLRLLDIVAFNDWVEFVMLWFAVEFVRLMDSIVVVFSVLDVDDELVVLAVVRAELVELDEEVDSVEELVVLAVVVFDGIVLVVL